MSPCPEHFTCLITYFLLRVYKLFNKGSFTCLLKQAILIENSPKEYTVLYILDYTGNVINVRIMP